MKERILSENIINQFQTHLAEEEKSKATIEKYMRDVKKFYKYVGEKTITKEVVIEYKKQLIEKEYAVRSINSMLASINSLFEYCGWNMCRVKNLKMQRQIYCKEEKELTKAEYLRLVTAAKKDTRLELILTTICSTGIRISELKYFTVEAIKRGEIIVDCKNKTRIILIPRKLRAKLKAYVKTKNITSGPIFITKNGNPLNRSNIWAQMKRLCNEAGVPKSKVFPHNLRKLFARVFYKTWKDIAKLADVLGHSSIETTRIYIMSTGTEHRKMIEHLNLII